MTAATAIPATIIGGFLGAGKTTLLNHILRSSGGLRIAVLVNDFGGINIDAQLVIAKDRDVLSLSNGCICCTMRSGLIRALKDVARRSPAPEHIVIETSGVSNPYSVSDALGQLQTGSLVRLDGVLTVVDACNFPCLVDDDRDLALDQIAAADIVLINKIDAVDRRRADAICHQIRELSPGARIVEMSYGRVPLELAVGFDTREEKLANALSQAIGALSDNPGTVKRAHVNYRCVSWTSDQPVSLDAISKVITRLPPSIYRGKGVLFLAEEPDRRAIWHLVGNRSTIEADRPWAESPRSQLVLVGSASEEDLNRISLSFERCIA